MASFLKVLGGSLLEKIRYITLTGLMNESFFENAFEYFYKYCVIEILNRTTLVFEI